MTRLLAAALAAAVVATGVQSCRLADERTAHAETKAEHATQLAALQEAARVASEQARAEEQRRTAEVQKAADEAHQALERARADAVAAADAGDRLRQRIATLTAARCASPAGAAAASAGTPADATARMLADVQRRLDAAADGIAGFADRAHAAGRACESGYNALTSP